MSRSFSLFPESSQQKQFYENLYQDYINLMYYTAIRYCSGTTDLHDIVQEAFLNLLNHYDTLKSLAQPALASYIYFTVKNASIDFRRREVADKKLEAHLSEHARLSIDDLPDMIEMLFQEEKYNELEAILDLLSETDNLILTGKYFLDYSDAELAAFIGCKPSSIRMMLTRARRNALNLIKERGYFKDEEERKHAGAV